MQKPVRAENSSDAGSRFGPSFYGGRTQPELDERVQLGKFLEAAAHTELLQYPLEVTHVRNQRPDFKLILGKTQIGVEATKVANEELESARSLQRRRRMGTLSVTPFLRRPDPAASRRERVIAALTTPSMLFPNDIADEDSFWLETALAIIKRKHRHLNKPDYCRGKENWLLIWDKLSSTENELSRRVARLEDVLCMEWKEDFFTKLIVEQAHFSCFAILSKQGTTWLPDDSHRP